MVDRAFKDRASLLLKGLEEGREVRAYLRRFGQQAEGCFAVIKVGGAIIERDLNALAEGLGLLNDLGLSPIVVYGAGPQLNAELAAKNFGEERVDGLRVTPKDAMPIVSHQTGQMGYQLTVAMRRFGASGVVLHPGALRAKAIDVDRYGMVGDVDEIDRQALLDLVSAGMVPLVSCVHPDSSGQLLNVNADNVARSIAKAICPQKIVFVTGVGSILNGDGERISSINLAAERQEIFASSWLEGGMRHKLQEIADLLDALPPSSSVSITSTDGLIRELFTHSGSGTLVRKGEAIERVEEPKLGDIETLVETAFGRTLKTTYWEDFRPRYCLLSEQRRAGAVVTSINGVDVLDKFAVLGAARGEGLAKSLWDALTSNSPSLVWRSRRANPFNGFYHAKADGSVRRGMWTVYWADPALEENIGEIADALAERPGDFEGDA